MSKIYIRLEKPQKYHDKEAFLYQKHKIKKALLRY